MLNVGTDEVDWVLFDLGVGTAEAVTDRDAGFEGVGKPVPGVVVLGRSAAVSEDRVFATGSEGRGFDGGGRGGCLIEVMVAEALMTRVSRWTVRRRRLPAGRLHEVRRWRDAPNLERASIMRP